MVALEVNGKRYHVDIDQSTPLLWVLRDTLRLTGTKYGCGIAQCGACTVHVDGTAARSCVIPVREVVGRQVTTIEGLADGPMLHPVQQAWLDEDVVQCGYCQPGQIMAAAALLAHEANPSDDQIDRALAGNICRCGTYQRVRSAIKRAGAQMRVTVNSRGARGGRR